MSEPERLRKYFEACHTEGGKISAAEKMVEAKKLELEAAMAVGDWELVEKARETCVLTYEEYLDVYVSSLRRLKDMGTPYA